MYVREGRPLSHRASRVQLHHSHHAGSHPPVFQGPNQQISDSGLKLRPEITGHKLPDRFIRKGHCPERQLAYLVL
jgi:hypothetical protein